MSLHRKLKALYPAADPMTAWRVRDDGDGPYIDEWNLPGDPPSQEALDAVTLRRRVQKDLVEARMAAAGTLQAAMAILMLDADKWRRWNARAYPWVYADDPDTVALIAAVGSDPDIILAA